jgi:hypothetical protein
MATIKKLLDFLNLLDDSGRLSITNVSAIVLVAKLALTSNPDLATVGSTAIGLLNYMHKRSVISGSTNDDSKAS